jgi:cell division protein FtsQ
VSDEDDDTTGGVVISLERPPSDDDEPVLPSLTTSDDEAPGDDPAPALVVDDRMRRRRLAVELAAKDRRYRRIAWILLPFALLITGVVVAYLPMLDVDRIVVGGNTQEPAETVVWASRIDRGDPLLTIDVVGAERRIERLAWVDEATVTREWPGTVRITVTERIPIATLTPGEGRPTGLVDRDGRVLEVGGIVPPDLVELTGLDPYLAQGRPIPAAGRPALALAVALSEQLPGAALSVNVDLDVSLAVGGIARFGSDEQLHAKLVALEAILSDVDTENMAVLDLRVPTNPTITRG